MRIHAVVALWSVALPSFALAQDTNLNVFLFEKSYAALGTPSVEGAPGYYAAEAEPDLLAEAQIALHLPIFRQATSQRFQDGAGRGFNLFLTPQMRLRALDVASGPIHSMSFLPKFTLQHLWVSGGNDAGEAGRRHVWGVSFVSGHHSNGGSTCEFVDQVQRASDGDCVVPAGQPVLPTEQREVRVNGGNFSTNYIELGGGYRIGTTESTGGDHWTWFVEGYVAWQHHHTWVGFPLPGGPDPAFGELYGLDRKRIDMSAHLLLSRAVALRGAARLDWWSPDAERYPGADHHTLESEFMVQFVNDLGSARWYHPGMLAIGLRYVGGMDHYNTQYVRDISHWQFAIVIDPWSPRIS